MKKKQWEPPIVANLSLEDVRKLVRAWGGQGDLESRAEIFTELCKILASGPKDQRLVTEVLQSVLRRSSGDCSGSSGNCTYEGAPSSL